MTFSFTTSQDPRTSLVLAEVNLQTGAGWHLEDRLAGGVLGGAFRVKDESNVAVFKWHDPTSQVPHNPDAEEVVRYLRANGYPTPAWLASGTTRSGIPWSLQELIPGKAMGQLDDTGADLIIELLKLQRRLSPPTSLSWSDFMRKLVFSTHPSHDRIRSADGDLGLILAEALALAAPHHAAKFPEAEMVHCDLSVSNILLHKGRLSGVIDVDAAGRGCAVYDAMCPCLADVLWSPIGGPIDRLHEFAVDTYGPAPVAIAAATIVVEKLDWLAHSSQSNLEAGAAKCGSWIAAVRALI